MGFEPTLEFPLNTLSKRAPSATRPSLRRESTQKGLLGSTKKPRHKWLMCLSLLLILWVNASDRNLTATLPTEAGQTQEIFSGNEESESTGVVVKSEAGDEIPAGVEPEEAPAAAARAALPFVGEAGSAGTFVLSTT